MGAKLVDQPVAAIGVAEGEQALGQHFHAHWRTFIFRQFVRQQHRQPIAAEQLAEWRARAGLGQ
jgi:hypothetical protein